MGIIDNKVNVVQFPTFNSFKCCSHDASRFNTKKQDCKISYDETTYLWWLREHRDDRHDGQIKKCALFIIQYITTMTKKITSLILNNELFECCE